jgi:hypothetical protein
MRTTTTTSRNNKNNNIRADLLHVGVRVKEDANANEVLLIAHRRTLHQHALCVPARDDNDDDDVNDDNDDDDDGANQNANPSPKSL